MWPEIMGAFWLFIEFKKIMRALGLYREFKKIKESFDRYMRKKPYIRRKAWYKNLLLPVLLSVLVSSAISVFLGHFYTNKENNREPQSKCPELTPVNLYIKKQKIENE